LAERARTAAGHLGQPEPPPRKAGTLADNAAWARRTVAAAHDLTDKCSADIARQEEEIGQAQAAAEAARARVGLADDVALEDALRVANEDAGAARKDLATAEQHKPLAADLDQRLTKAGPFVAALDELTRLLTDGKFLGALVRRKQRALLGVASEILLSMTRRRFGFAESFQIVDGLTGQPRDVKTLSGGETFLASLALALALVELAGRGGDRLEALFLDEGFGSLDANAVNEALDALGQQSEGGRLVAVISHLRSIVEGFENVLVVTKGPNGSQVHWAKDDERDQLMTEEVPVQLVPEFVLT
jgi:exonuclease SbcC